MSHNLSKIWFYAESYLKEDISVANINFIKKIVYWFNMLDPDSFVFRYETDKKIKRV